MLTLFLYFSGRDFLRTFINTLTPSASHFTFFIIDVKAPPVRKPLQVKKEHAVTKIKPSRLSEQVSLIGEVIHEFHEDFPPNRKCGSMLSFSH